MVGWGVETMRVLRNGERRGVWKRERASPLYKYLTLPCSPLSLFSAILLSPPLPPLPCLPCCRHSLCSQPLISTNPPPYALSLPRLFIAPTRKPPSCVSTPFPDFPHQLTCMVPSSPTTAFDPRLSLQSPFHDLLPQYVAPFLTRPLLTAPRSRLDDVQAIMHLYPASPLKGSLTLSAPSPPCVTRRLLQGTFTIARF